MDTKKLHIETLAVHGGQIPDPVTRARGLPVWRTTAYNFTSAKQGADLFALKELGFTYTRLGDPTTDMLEKRLALLEGGKAAVATSSGTAAIHYAAMTLAQSGDEIVSASNLYGGTHTMFSVLLPQQGITVRFADVKEPASFEKLITDKTRFLYTETIGNPSLDVADIGALAKIAHSHHIPLVVDSTFTPPVNYRPIEDGADIVIHSLSKWIGGHGSAMGGAIVDAGKFDWKSGNVPLMKDEDPNYHNMRWAYDLPAEIADAAFAWRFRMVPLRNLGACLSPDNSWIFLQGLESLPSRMPRHNANAKCIADWLKKHPKISWVRYPGNGGMVVFGLGAMNGRNAVQNGEIFINNLQLVSHVTNVGDAKTIATHPASTTHSQLSEEEQIKAGLQPELIRLSVGLEHPDDIIADMDQALANV